jgi:hypothetical protein
MIRGDCMKILKKDTTLPKKHKNERKLIKSLRENELVYMRPDKGQGVVVMGKDQYHQKMDDVINSGNYESWSSRAKVPIDTVQTKVKEKLKSLINRKLLDSKLAKSLTVSNPQMPKMYGIPKVHKSGNKMRPIVSKINSPTYLISKWLLKEFGKLKTLEDFSIKNTPELIEKLKDKNLRRTDKLVSFDVTSLYDNVPVKDTLIHFNEWLCDQDIPDEKVQLYFELTELCLEQTQFTINGELKKQKDNLGMGEILAPFMANFCLGILEREMKKKDWFPRFWVRYMDDVLAIVKQGSEEKILKNFNSNNLFPSIKFTMEKENDGYIPFLDLKIIRNTGEIKFDIYRKQTSTQQYIPISSSHPWTQKMAAFNSMLHRLCTTPLDTSAYDRELKYIMETAEINGYKKSTIQKLLQKHKNKQALRKISTLKIAPDKITNNYLVLPFVPDLTHELEKVFKKYDIKIAYESVGKLGDLLGNQKDKTPDLEKSGIYLIKCKKCGKDYIGQSRRRVGKKFDDHQGYITAYQLTKSGIADHVIMENH